MVNEQYRDEFIEAITKSKRFGWYIQGKELEIFDSKLYRYCGRALCWSCQWS